MIKKLIREFIMVSIALCLSCGTSYCSDNEKIFVEYIDGCNTRLLFTCQSLIDYDTEHDNIELTVHKSRFSSDDERVKEILSNKSDAYLGVLYTEGDSDGITIYLPCEGKLEGDGMYDIMRRLLIDHNYKCSDEIANKVRASLDAVFNKVDIVIDYKCNNECELLYNNNLPGIIIRFDVKNPDDSYLTPSTVPCIIDSIMSSMIQVIQDTPSGLIGPDNHM